MGSGLNLIKYSNTSENKCKQPALANKLHKRRLVSKSKKTALHLLNIRSPSIVKIDCFQLLFYSCLQFEYRSIIIRGTLFNMLLLHTVVIFLSFKNAFEYSVLLFKQLPLNVERRKEFESIVQLLVAWDPRLGLDGKRSWATRVMVGE